MIRCPALHDPADNCTPFCIEVPQPKGKTKVLHRHLPDADCISECRSREADCGIICTPCAQKIRDDLDTLVDAWAATRHIDLDLRSPRGEEQ